jgi:hypothetical protein
VAADDADGGTSRTVLTPLVSSSPAIAWIRYRVNRRCGRSETATVSVSGKRDTMQSAPSKIAQPSVEQ